MLICWKDNTWAKATDGSIWYSFWYSKHQGWTSKNKYSPSEPIPKPNGDTITSSRAARDIVEERRRDQIDIDTFMLKLQYWHRTWRSCIEASLVKDRVSCIACLQQNNLDVMFNWFINSVLGYTRNHPLLDCTAITSIYNPQNDTIAPMMNRYSYFTMKSDDPINAWCKWLMIPTVLLLIKLHTLVEATVSKNPLWNIILLLFSEWLHNVFIMCSNLKNTSKDPYDVFTWTSHGTDRSDGHLQSKQSWRLSMEQKNILILVIMT